MLLERDDARRARASRKSKVTILPSEQQEFAVKKPAESNEVIENACGGEEAGVLAIGPEEEDRVEDIIEVHESVKGVVTEFDDGFERLMRIGPEVFEDDRAEDMGVEDKRLNANDLAGVKTIRRSKGNSVQRWIDNVETMGTHNSNPRRTTAAGGDHHYSRHHASLMVEGSAHESTAEHDVVSGAENRDEVGTSEDDAKTVITAIEIPIGESTPAREVEIG